MGATDPSTTTKLLPKRPGYTLLQREVRPGHEASQGFNMI